MAVGSFTQFVRFKASLLKGNVNFSGGAFRAHLFLSAAALSAGMDVSTVASLANQLVGTRGYDTAGKVISNPAVALSSPNAVVSADGFSWSASGGNLGSTTAIKYLVIAVSGGGMPINFTTLSTSGFAVPSGSALKINGGAASSGRIFELS